MARKSSSGKSSGPKRQPPTGRKIVLVSRSGYHPRHDGLLLYLLSRRMLLFCATGKECGRWKDAVDGLCASPHRKGHPAVETTSHPDEALEQVLAFARDWITEEPTEVEVIEV